MMPIKGDVEYAAPSCFVCLPRTAEVEARRRPCVERGSHRPTGPLVEHRHVGGILPILSLRVCADCQTVVRDER